MTDEKYVFVTDVRDKKRTARGSFNKRTHAGKGGAVKFPSDFLTRKELNAMNGEVKSYRLNDPMTWAEFKAMPDEIKISYISALRNKFGVPDSRIAKMMGTNVCSMSQMLTKLGISVKSRSGMKEWDIDGWTAFVHDIPELKTDTVMTNINDPDDIENQNVATDDVQEQEVTVPEEMVIVKPVVPIGGSMTFEGKAADALLMVERMLQDSNVRITVTWDLVAEEGVRCG